MDLIMLISEKIELFTSTTLLYIQFKLYGGILVTNLIE